MRRDVLALFLFPFLVCAAAAQENRSSFTGRVTDQTGAVIPHAQIVVTNADTGVKTRIQSNNQGIYTAPFLMPGTYEIDASLKGFQNYVHTGIVLEVEQVVSENIQMKVGSEDQTVTVNAETPLIDSSTSTVGETLTAEELEDLPSNGGNPLAFAHMAYGVVAKGKHAESQVTPFGNSTASDFAIGGGQSQSNELLMNGVPNMEDSARVAGFSPLMDAVEAVHVDVYSANASMGDTSGGTVNITTKAGTNHFHGSANEIYNGSRPFQALQYFSTGGSGVTSTHFNQYGGTIGGPIWIPHVFNGRDKLFFFYSHEGYHGNAPAITITSVPTLAERQGDFSAQLAANPADQLYNPYVGSYQTVAGTSAYVRAPIPHNCLTNLSAYCSGVANAGLTIDKAAAAYMAMMPAPNYNGPSTTADGGNNYFGFDPTTNAYNSDQLRVDYNVSSRDKIFAEVHRSTYDQTSGNVFHTGLTGTFSKPIHEGTQLDNVLSFSPSVYLESRLALSRFYTFSGPFNLGQSPTSVGFQGYLASNSTALALPYITWQDNNSIPSLSAEPGNSEYFDTIQFFQALSITKGRHNIKIGHDIRVNKNSAVSPGAADGAFKFQSSSEDFVTQSPNYSLYGTAQNFGGAFALFDLGLPSSGSYTIAQKYQFNSWYFAGFAQDDWKALSNVTISFGLRLVHENPLNESNNKMTAGWNPSLPNATTGPAEAAYAAAPNAALPVANFQPTGGVVYTTPGNRGAYVTPMLYVSPRLGFSYAPAFANGTLAIRGGLGIYVNPFMDYDGGGTYGYTQTTNMVQSLNANETPNTTLDDPFPTNPSAANYNPIQAPQGRYFLNNTELGSTIGYYAPLKVPYAEKYTLDIQKQFGKEWMFELGYMGSHQVHIGYTNDIAASPIIPYLSQTPTGDSAGAVAASNLLTASVSNPFYGTMPAYIAPNGVVTPNTTSLNASSTIQFKQLIRNYPEYSDVSASLTPGGSYQYHALMARAHRRMTNSLQLDFNFEYSRQLGATQQLNAGGPLWWGETTSDFPLHASVLALYQLPFGRGHLFLNKSLLADEIIGGWQVSGIYQYLSGTPIQWSTNVVYNGNWHDFNNHPHVTSKPSFNVTPFDGIDTASTYPNYAADQPGSYNYRTFPEYALRAEPTNNFDFSISKKFFLVEHVMIVPRVDVFNALNHAQMSAANVSPTSANFGYITTQLNTNRTMQGAIRVVF